MSSFLFGGPTRVSLRRQDDPFELVEVEATLEEVHTGSAETTDHPVEDGADITDHIRRNPDELKLKAVFSNYPVLLLASFRADPAIPGGDPARRAEDAYKWLREVKDQGLLLEVTTTLREPYVNMAVVGMNVVRDKDRRNVLEVDLNLREIIIATTEQVAAPTTENPARGAASQLGRKATTPASAATSGASQSLLSGLFSAFGV